MIRIVAFLVLLLLAGPVAVAVAQDRTPLQITRQAAITAFQAGDLAKALNLSEQAVAIARATRDTPAAEFAHALSALAFVMTRDGVPSVPARTLWLEALALLGEADQMATQAGATVSINLAGYELAQGRGDAGLARLDAALRTARQTPLHGVVAQSVADLYLQFQAFPQAVRALGELTDVAPDLLAATYSEVYARLTTLIEQAETAGRANDVVTLLEGKQIILRTYLPGDQAGEAIRGLFFQRFFALRDTGDYRRVQKELTLWLKTGTPTEEEMQFIRQMVDTGMALAQGANINTLERLADARTTMAFTAGLDNPDDHRIGLAFRAIASAQSHLGRIDQIDRTLGQAIDILQRSETGRTHLPAVLSELAWNAYLQGDPDRAEALYAQADQAQMTVDASGDDPSAAIDRANDAANRARFHLDTGHPDQALARIAQARDLARTAAADPWRLAFLNNRLSHIALSAQLETGQGDPSVEPLLAAIKTLRSVAPPDNPEYSLALANAADTLLYLGHSAAGRALLNEAIAVNDTALPAVAPQAIDTLTALARLEIISGNRADAVALLRRVGDARKSPLYRARLPESAGDFELLAWALVDDPRTRTDIGVNEAFEALQWTQVTQSASALSYLETRLALDDPARSALIRQRQNLVDAHADTMARLTLARTAGPGAGASAGDLAARLERTEIALAGADARLNALGLDTLGIGRVMPVPLAQVQAMLGPDEALITFLLPSLNPDWVKGLDASSNHVIAVTGDQVHIARIDTVSRAGLNRRITGFRCEMAISDPGCGAGGAQGLRGAMLAGADDPARPQDHFDHAAAFALYDDLFGGIRGVLETHRHLIIVPPADMLRLPFQALVTAPPTGLPLADAPWMIRQNAISVLPSIASLRALRRDGRGARPLTRMLGFGDPAIGTLPDADCGALTLASLRAAPPSGQHMSSGTAPGGIAMADTAYLRALERLPDSVCELQAIATRFAPERVQLNLGAGATESRVKAMNTAGTLANFDVLVFATHGLTAGQAGAASPGLVLTPPGTPSAHDDGLLSAAEISALDIDAQLVVLSACNTAAGESGAADGLSGLARAFFRAGAQSLLVTHWSVYSQAAVDISTGLFGALQSQPQSQSQGRHSAALRAATLNILGDPHRPAYQYHPSYWAAFSIIGAS